MHIAVELGEATLRQLLAELLPITVLLDEAQGLEGRWIRIDPVRAFQFSLGEGIRLATSGALHGLMESVSEGARIRWRGRRDGPARPY